MDFVSYFAVYGSDVCEYENNGIALLASSLFTSLNQSLSDTPLGFRLICFAGCLRPTSS